MLREFELFILLWLRVKLNTLYIGARSYITYRFQTIFFILWVVIYYILSYSFSVCWKGGGAFSPKVFLNFFPPPPPRFLHRGKTLNNDLSRLSFIKENNTLLVIIYICSYNEPWPRMLTEFSYLLIITSNSVRQETWKWLSYCRYVNQSINTLDQSIIVPPVNIYIQECCNRIFL